jgi:hypothetical protein
MAKAQTFMKHGRRDKTQLSQFGEMDEDKDEWAILVDVSDDKLEGTSVFAFDTVMPTNRFIGKDMELWSI